jgi:hypothetical protein
VRVSCLAPGATKTQFAAQADMAGTLAFRLGAMAVRVSPRALVTRAIGYLQA